MQTLDAHKQDFQNRELRGKFGQREPRRQPQTKSVCLRASLRFICHSESILYGQFKLNK